jgi:hypothetical protein
MDIDGIQAERGLLDYPDMKRLPHNQDGFTLSVSNPTLRFQYLIVSEFGACLNGEYGITSIELHDPFIFVFWDWNYPGADYEEAVALMKGVAAEYLDQREII